MGNIINKLNLNKNPQSIEDNTLIFAKNIKVLRDGSISRDDGCLSINFDINTLINKTNTLKQSTLTKYNTAKNSLDSVITQINSLPTFKDAIVNYINTTPGGVSIYKSFVKNYITLKTGTGTNDNPIVVTFLYPNYTKLLNYINTKTGKSFTDFPSPVFSKSIYEYIVSHYIGGNGVLPPIPPTLTISVLQSLTSFNYDDYMEAINLLKLNNPDIYANNFFDIGDCVYEDGEGKSVVEQMMLNYIQIFIFIYGAELEELNIKNKKENDITKSNLNLKKDYYNSIMSTCNKLINDCTYYNNIFSNNFTTEYNIIKIIPNNSSFYIFMYNGENSIILVYNEISQELSYCNCNWNYSGNGIINGYVVTNITNNVILNITEYINSNSKNIPFKSINLSLSSHSDDESIYTQLPKIPLYNLNFVEYYDNVIPNGVYQFFIRYKISDNFYTNWFPASRELYTGNSHTQNTNIGGLKYLDTTLNSNKSFVLSVDKPLTDKVKYESFQIGFIVSSDDTVVARSWKHFDMNTSTIYFDYNKTYITEIDITELTNVMFNIYNSKNITYFKNKLYLSNYTETNFNPDFEEISKNININIKNISSYEKINEYDSKPISLFEKSGIKYIRSINSINVDDTILKLLSNNKDYFSTYHSDKYTVTENGITMITTQTKATFTGDINHSKYEWYYNVDTLISKGDNLLNIINARCRDYYSIRTTDGAFKESSAVTSYYLNGIELVYTVINGTSSDRLYNLIEFSIDLNKLKLSEATYKTQYTTLIPHQIYRFYVHYVTEVGEITNGYRICGDIEIFDTNPKGSETPIIYPEFSNIVIPTGYVSCFFSIQHVYNNVAQLYNIKTLDDNSIIADCMELDTRLINLKENIPCVIGNFNYKGTYHASFDNSKLKYFGASGKVELSALNIEDKDYTRGFVVIDYDNTNDEDNLIKCTPFITKDTYGTYQDMNLGGFICVVKKLDDCTDLYISGSDVYDKKVTVSSTTKEESISLTVNSTLGVDGKYKGSNDYNIYSQYNLNYLSNSLDVTNNIKTIDSKVVLLKLVNSIQLSDIYELKDMYKTYTRKLFSKYKYKNNVITFDNTVRSSILEGDEAKINIFKFNATDYYNIPTNKGSIVNLAAIGSSIVVHTKDTIFKFSGNNSLSAAGGEEIKVKQTEAFDNGISEVFGSEFGFAGLNSKSDAVITEEGYIFYDKSSNNIYVYSGEGQISKISDGIKKLLDGIEITSVKFANDYNNDKIYMQFTTKTSNTITLSLNLRLKSFISIHDFAFDNAFNTKSTCYLYNNSSNNIYSINKAKHDYSIFAKQNIYYPSYKLNDLDACVIDVLTNVNYERFKTLNSISWNCSQINSFYYNQNNNYENDDIYKSKMLAEENLNRDYAGDKLIIYSDFCSTNEIDITKRGKENGVSISDISAPTFKDGEWKLNYFRNILNSNKNYDNYSDNSNSNMLGKYFVARFILDRNKLFKLENVNFKLTLGI